MSEIARLGEAATGTIDPEQRLEVSMETVAEIAERLAAGEFKIDTDLILPCGCVDGRLCRRGERRVAPNAAGGTLSLVMADALTTKTVEGDTVCEHMRNVALFIKNLDNPKFDIGVHGDTRDESTGCGANANLEPILEKVISNHRDIAEFLKTKGVTVSSELDHSIISRANDLLAGGYAKTLGSQVVKVATEIAGEQVYESYDGPHNEVLLNINNEPGTTLDRKALEEIYGSKYQVFNVDLWSLREGSKIISGNDAQAGEKLIAALYYNMATAMTLAGPGLRV